MLSQILEFAKQKCANVAPLLRRAVDLTLPPDCPVTGQKIAAPGLLSAEGWAQLSFIEDPICVGCGVPFAHDEGADAKCGRCLAAPRVFNAARAAVVYDDVSQKLMTAFKFADRTELAPMFGAWLARTGADWLTSRSLVIPAPLHRNRLLARRYNQAALLAQAVARRSGAPCELRALRRKRSTKPQSALSSVEARQRNVAGAFIVAGDYRAMIAGTDIVLVDDVFTTGATLTACARALKAAGAASVNALVLARVVK